MIIINGSRVERSDKFMPPIAELTDPSGNLIMIWSRDPLMLAAAELAAIGHVPAPPQLSGGGSFEVSALDPRTGQPIAFTYNPGPADRDRNEVVLYQARLTEWNTRAAVIRAAVESIANGK